MIVRHLLVGAGVILLLATMGLALSREIFREPERASPAPGVAMTERGRAHRALLPEEERFAAALWPVHAEAKLAAVRMTFAGVAYKTEGPDPARLVATVAPLVDGFRAATTRVREITAPASLQPLHARYLEALTLYEQASAAMLRVAEDGRDDHLVHAQALSVRAAEDMLRVGDVLWPGEYKPN